MSLNEVEPPLTKEFLIRALKNQIKMHEFMRFSSPGLPSYMNYVEGLKESSAYLIRRLESEQILRS